MLGISIIDQCVRDLETLLFTIQSSFTGYFYMYNNIDLGWIFTSGV
jgi:hypothetical protein